MNRIGGALQIYILGAGKIEHSIRCTKRLDVIVCSPDVCTHPNRVIYVIEQPPKLHPEDSTRSFNHKFLPRRSYAKVRYHRRVVADNHVSRCGTQYFIQVHFDLGPVILKKDKTYGFRMVELKP